MHFATSGAAPFLFPKVPFGTASELRAKRNAFDLSGLVGRRMRPKPDEQYDVYEVDVTGEEADGDILDYDDIDDPEAFG